MQNYKKTFLDILNDYQHRQDFQYADLYQVLQLSRYHYMANGLHDPLVSGRRPPVHFQHTLSTDDVLQSRKQFTVRSPMNVSSNSSVHWNNSPSTTTFLTADNVPEFTFTAPRNIFPILIDDHATPMVQHTTPPPPITKSLPKYTKHIDVNIQCFADLLRLLDEHEYREDTEYNIDLKALVQVKTELHELDRMVGIAKFKDAVLDQILYFVQNLHVGKEPDFMHTILCGPPGTGKTEIAKILGRMYSKIGILKNGTYKKVCRSDLIAGYLGQTAIKTRKVVNECLGGCLFIDEAYSLACSDATSSDSYSKECLDTLCEALSDHKGELMVIIAGYEKELGETFFRANRGLESRFIWRFVLEEYSAKELADIFHKKIVENEWTTTMSKGELAAWFQKHRDQFRNFGRDMELLFTYSKIAHGRRIYGKSADLRKQLDPKDIEAGYATFLANSKKTESREIMGLYV